MYILLVPLLEMVSILKGLQGENGQPRMCHTDANVVCCYRWTIFSFTPPPSWWMKGGKVKQETHSQCNEWCLVSQIKPLSKCTFMLIIVRLSRGSSAQAFLLPKVISEALLSSCLRSVGLPAWRGLHV